MHDSNAEVIRQEKSTFFPNWGVFVDFSTRAKSTKFMLAATIRFRISTFMSTCTDRYGPRYLTAESSLPTTGAGYFGGCHP